MVAIEIYATCSILKSLLFKTRTLAAEQPVGRRVKFGGPQVVEEAS